MAQCRGNGFETCALLWLSGYALPHLDYYRLVPTPLLQIAKAILSGQRLAVPPREAQPGPDRLPPDIEREYLQVTAMAECCFMCWLWLGRHSAQQCVTILEYRHVPQCTVSMWTPGVCQLRVSVKDSSFNLFSL